MFRTKPDKETSKNEIICGLMGLFTFSFLIFGVGYDTIGFWGAVPITLLFFCGIGFFVLQKIIDHFGSFGDINKLDHYHVTQTYIRQEEICNNESNYDVNKKDGSGRILLHFHADLDDKELKVVLNKTNDINTRDMDGLTPIMTLYETLGHGRFEMFLDHGADVSIKDNFGK